MNDREGPWPHKDAAPVLEAAAATPRAAPGRRGAERQRGPRPRHDRGAGGRLPGARRAGARRPLRPRPPPQRHHARRRADGAGRTRWSTSRASASTASTCAATAAPTRASGRSTSRRSWRSTTRTSRWRPRSPPGSRRGIGDELNLPVFLYGAVATDPDRARPRDFRREGLEELERAIDEGRAGARRGPAPAAPDGRRRAGGRPPAADRPERLAARGDPHRGPRHRGARARVRRRPARRARPRPLPAGGRHGAGVDEHRGPPRIAAGRGDRGRARRGRAPGRRGRRGRAGRPDPARGPARAEPSALGIRGFRPGQVLELRVPGLGRGRA